MERRRQAGETSEIAAAEWGEKEEGGKAAESGGINPRTERASHVISLFFLSLTGRQTAGNVTETPGP